tara:strand:- start:3527 stop:3964 length:438 start_codon:yes stop_codon:yes gene_type:complete
LAYRVELILVHDIPYPDVLRAGRKLGSKPGGLLGLGFRGRHFRLQKELRMDRVGTRSALLAVTPVGIILMIKGEAVFVQVFLGKGVFFAGGRMIQREGRGSRDSLDRFLGNGMLVERSVVGLLLHLNDFLGLLAVEDDVLVDRHV